MTQTTEQTLRPQNIILQCQCGATYTYTADPDGPITTVRLAKKAAQAAGWRTSNLACPACVKQIRELQRQWDALTDEQLAEWEKREAGK